MFTFNLINEKWIPCLMPDGNKEELSFKDTLIKAPDISEIFDPSPLVTAALYRLLLVVLHRNFGPANEAEWGKLWNNGLGGWETNRLIAYLGKWHDRFDLFDDKYPFYQCSAMPTVATDKKRKEKSYSKSVANMVHELATGNNATLFDHTNESIGYAVSPAEAARLLAAFQSFAVGGLLTFEVGQDPKLFKSADNAPLVKGAVTLARGQNLFQSLMLNLHKYNLADEEPFKMDKDDAPAWERDENTTAVDRQPIGYLDLLTWQSRRVRLIPELDENRQTIVKQVVIMKGYQFPDGFQLHMKEPMLAFHKLEKPKKGQDPWPAIAIREDRAVWRDSLSLFQSIEEERARPKMLDWLSDLHAYGVVPQSATYDLSVMGLTTDRASISLWRHERLPLPLQYLRDENLVEKLREALELTERIGKNLNNSIWNQAKLSIAPDVDRLSDSQKKDVNNLTASLSPTRHYWAALGTYFSRLVVDLANDKSLNGDYGMTVLPQWAGEVRKAAGQAFHEATDSLDHTGRWLRAVTIAENQFNLKLSNLIKEFLEPYEKSKKEGGEQ